MKTSGILIVAIALSALLLQSHKTAAAGGKPGRRLPPHEYGSLEMVRSTSDKTLPSALFRHWTHRAKHSCRLCHIDIGFAMEAGQTIITEGDNREGRFCGTCHNGKEAFAPTEASLLGKTRDNCQLCHTPLSLGRDAANRRKFERFAEDLPSGRFGNRVDWPEATSQGKINPKDFIEGISFPREKMKHEEGRVDMDAKLKGLPDIVFSHEEHAAWTGCELCHPDVFSLKAGQTKFSMQDIFAGRYCGSCHGKVAFPLQDCGRCHSKPVM